MRIAMPSNAKQYGMPQVAWDEVALSSAMQAVLHV
jgi:hypothetical protein